MRVTVRLFAGAKALAQAGAVEVQLPAGATYADLAAALAKASPSLQPLAAASRFAADTEYRQPADAVDAAAQIALIPPVSGG
ncbi:MAG: MoaD/ThiS family protein [Planctomycetota bacterium]